MDEAVNWYEEQRKGLGDDFFTQLSQVLMQIQKQPESFGFWLGSSAIRRFKLKRFPYDVLYEVRPDQVRILCLRHEKRHPSYGIGRR